MSWPRLLRVVTSRQRIASLPRTTHRPELLAREDAHRHPAMQGIKVSPVHGHHCICDRCHATDSRLAA
jgi:hypothetical protein